MHKIEGREDKTAGRKKEKKEKKERNILYSNKDKLKTGAGIRVSTLRGVLRNRDSQVIM